MDQGSGATAGHLRRDPGGGIHRVLVPRVYIRVLCCAPGKEGPVGLWCKLALIYAKGNSRGSQLASVGFYTAADTEFVQW